MERGEAERGAGGHFGISGGLSEGRCDRDMLACTHVPCTQRMSLPDTRKTKPCRGMGSRVEAPYIPRSMYCGLITNSYERLPGPEHHHRTRHY